MFQVSSCIVNVEEHTKCSSIYKVVNQESTLDLVKNEAHVYDARVTAIITSLSCQCEVYAKYYGIDIHQCGQNFAQPQYVGSSLYSVLMVVGLISLFSF